MLPVLQPGDIFCTRNPMWLGRAINAAQTVWASDNKSEFSHAGIITDPAGTTFEALWTVRSRNIFTDCAVERILIGRHDDMTKTLFTSAFGGVETYRGRWYPFHRLIFHMVPPLAKYISADNRYLVCSELTAKFLHGAGLVDFFLGKNPDHIADMIRRWKDWRIVYDGIMADDPDLLTERF